MPEQAVKLTLEDARTMVAAAMREAQSQGVAMVVAVVDSGGHLLALERGDGANLGSIEIVQGKARTAVMFGQPTAVMELAAQASPALASLPNLMPFGGAIPIRSGNSIIGAIAASGGLAAQDVACAEAGMRAFETGFSTRPSA